MKTQLIIFVLAASVVALYLIWVNIKNKRSQADTDTSRPSEEHLPGIQKQNDKLVVVNGINYTDLQTILTGFCNLYNKEYYHAQLRLTKITEGEFAITFPYDIEFEYFCYFINYIHYPMGFDKSFNVIAWATIKSSDTWVIEKSVNKKAMLFVPSDDTDYDNVFMTTIDNIGFKLGFAVGEEKQLLDRPKKRFLSPTVKILELADKEHTDFK